MSSQALALSNLRDSLRYLLYLVYCVEGGLFLALVPWSRLWTQNYFFERFPLARAIGHHVVARGLVSGLGAALLLHGFQEVVAAVFGSRSKDRATDRAPRAGDPASPRGGEWD